MKNSAVISLVFFSAFTMIGFTTGCSGKEKALPEVSRRAQNPYLGETPPGDDPIVFAPGTVSTPDTIEMGIAFSIDGNEIYFARSAGPEISSNFSIWICREGKDGWDTPQVAGFSSHRDFAPFMMPDGRRLLFYSQDRSDPEYRGGTYMTQRIGDSWSLPVFYSEAYCLTSSLDGTLFFSGGGQENRNILTCRETADGFTEPKDLVGGVNTEAFEAHSFVSPNGNFLLFDSSRPGDYENSGIHVSFRTEDGNWSEALSLGPKINGTQSIIPSLSPDGEYIFFSRENDIWWVSARVIQELKEKLRNN